MLKSACSIWKKKETSVVVTFKLADHDYRPGVKVVEIRLGEMLLGEIFPTDRGIKIASEYIVPNLEAAIEIDRRTDPQMPFILVHLIEGSRN